MREEINRLLGGLLDGGLIFEKEVKKCTPTSGAIYLPNELIGRKFRVLLVPKDFLIAGHEERIFDTENDIRVLTRIIEKITGKKIRTILEENKDELEKMRNEMEEEKKKFSFIPQKEEPKEEIKEEENKVIKIET